MQTSRLDDLTFGTDGWRDVIADRFTTANLGRATQAYAEHLLEGGKSRVLVGYDTRFMGRRFALHVGGVLAANGLEVAVSDDYLPTPALSFAVKQLQADGGVMITASHNPAEYSGFKLKGSYGGSAFDSTYRDVARRVSDVSLERVAAAGGYAVDAFDVRGAYYDALDALIDVELLGRSGARLVHDAMGGSGAGWLAGYFARHGLQDRLLEERGRPDPLFYGVSPEPIARNLGVTMERMRLEAAGASFAVATDGDADRLGVVLPGGAYFNSHQIFAVLLDDLYRRGGRGSVVKTVTVSMIVERLARLRGLDVIETKVGFKYVVDAMLKGGVLIGGEESGGIGVSQHLFERDGLANALLLAEGLAATGVPLAEHFAALEEETAWRHAYDRLDLHLGSAEAMGRAAARLEDPPTSVAGRPVTAVERLDGTKIYLGDDAWLLVRASGTEPLLRVYCEAPDESAVRRTLAAMKELVTA